MIFGRNLSIDDLLALKPNGHFRIETTEGGLMVSIYQPGEPVERYLCPSPGVANQLGQKLTDMGLTGFIEGAL